MGLVLLVQATVTEAVSAEPGMRLETIVQDDALMLHADPGTRQLALEQMRAAGVDTVRISAVWREIAPEAGSSLKWVNLDRAVRAVDSAGLAVMLDLGVHAPGWAMGWSPPGTTGLNYPVPLAYADFVSAVAGRYSGDGSDGSGAPLPAVRSYTIWNEPNIDFFFGQQYDRRHRLVAADAYRALLYAAVPAISDRIPGSRVLIGATAPSADHRNDAGSLYSSPLAFARRLACVDPSLRPVRDAACARFRTLPGSGWSHHPYQLGAAPSASPYAGLPDDVGVSSLGRLTGLLGRLAQRRRISRADREVYVTEFAYETNAENHRRPWREDQQAYLLAAAEQLAWQTPHVRSFGQFQWRDVGTRAAIESEISGGPRLLGSWQSGLYREDGTPKPAAYNFAMPVTVRCLPRDGQTVAYLWARDRSTRDRTDATVERVGGHTVAHIATTTTRAGGVVDVRVPAVLGARYRVRFGASGLTRAVNLACWPRNRTRSKKVAGRLSNQASRRRLPPGP